MLIFIILIALIFIGIGLIIGAVIYNHRIKKYDPYRYDEIEWPYYVGVPILVLSLIVLIVVGCYVLTVQTEKQLDYEKMLESYTIISNYAEHYDELSEHEKCLTLTNIKSYNDKVRTAKYYKENIWIGCFYNELIADLPIIEYEGVVYN